MKSNMILSHSNRRRHNAGSCCDYCVSEFAPHGKGGLKSSRRQANGLRRLRRTVRRRERIEVRSLILSEI